MDVDILENTRCKFHDIVERFAHSDAEREALRRDLKFLLDRHQMDIRNGITRNMSDETVEIQNL